MFFIISDNRIRAAARTFLIISFAIILVLWGGIYTITAEAKGEPAKSASLMKNSGVNTQHVLDFNGDGRSEISVVRNINGSIVWFNYDGVSVPPAGITYNYFGLVSSDFLTPEDFDGDTKTDIAIWRPGASGSAGFYILQSTDNTVRFAAFGQTNDDISVVADYDGDGKADPAAYRCPQPGSPAGQCAFLYRGSLNNPTGIVTSIPWGFGRESDFSPYQGDFDGDGKNDFCIFRTDPSNPAQGQFILLRSLDQGVEYIPWGLSQDFLIPGDYDGDGKTDFCVRRTEGGFRNHYVLTRTGSGFFRQWGITGDTSVPGDYDGDDKTDFAVWRSSPNPGQSVFYILQSGSGNVTAFPWGQCPAGSCDMAVGDWVIH